MDGKWKPIRLAKHGTPLTHLFFADDLLLFAEASIDQAYVINAVLENYCRSSEAKVNKMKTKVFFFQRILCLGMPISSVLHWAFRLQITWVIILECP